MHVSKHDQRGDPPQSAPLVGVEGDAQAARGDVLFWHAICVLQALQNALP